MKIKNCQYDLDTKFAKPCSPCRKWNYTVRIPYKYRDHYIYINLHYTLSNCFIGLTGGQFINAFTLLPSEELEMEIIRKAKYSQSFHEERSLETEFEYDITNRFRKEITKKLDVNIEWETGGGLDLEVVDFSAKISGEIDLELITKTLLDTTVKSSYEVSKSQDIVIDYKTEIEHGFKSIRKLKNPNECRAVTYFFYQLMKKYEVKLELNKISFDFSKELNERFRKLKDSFTVLVEKFNVETYSLDLIPDLKKSNEKQVSSMNYRSNTGYKETVKLERSEFRELEASELNKKLASQDYEKSLRDNLKKELNKILSQPKYQIGEIWSKEICLRTNSTIVEPKVSECSICEPKSTQNSSDIALGTES